MFFFCFVLFYLFIFLSDSECPEGTFDPKCKLSSHNRSGDVRGGVRRLHKLRRARRDSVREKQCFLFSRFSLVANVLGSHHLWAKADFVSKLEPNPVVHEVSRLFAPFYRHSQWFYLTISIVWVTRASHADANKGVFSMFNIKSSCLPSPP